MGWRREKSKELCLLCGVRLVRRAGAGGLAHLLEPLPDSSATVRRALSKRDRRGYRTLDSDWDMPWKESDLRLAKEHLARAHTIVARQEAIIGELERDGHNTNSAKSVLETMRRSLEVLEQHKLSIERQLSRRR